MPNTTRGVGLFIAENIVAVLRAIHRPLGRSQVPKSKGSTPRGSKTHPRLSLTETQPSCDASRHRPTVAVFFCYEFQTITTFVVADFQ